MPNYQNGKIYCIRSRSRLDLVYIGSTIRPLSERLAGHRRNDDGCTSKKIIDIGDAYIELIESYPCANVEELHKREGHFQRSMDCVNQLIAGRTPAERYQDNREQILSRVKHYANDHKEKISSYHKQYRQDNHECILSHKKQYYQDNKEGIAIHQKQYAQDNKDDIATYKKQYNQDNKDKIATFAKQYRLEKKDMRNCICGVSYNYLILSTRLKNNKNV